MSPLATRTNHLLMIGLLLFCCGCPTPDGGDPEVWHDVSMKGAAEIIWVDADAVGGTEVSFRFTYEDGRVDEQPVKGLKIASIIDLPEGYEPQVGDQIRLQLDLRYLRRMSVGPPDFLHSKLKSRKFTCLGLVVSESKASPNVGDASPPKTDTNAYNPADPGDAENKNDDSSQLVWDTTGGGQIRFTITPDGNDYKVHIEESGPYLESDLGLVATDGKPHAATRAIFADPRDFATKKQSDTVDASSPPLPTGSWTTVLMIGSDGSKIALDQNSSRADFRAIYDFVKDGADKNLKPMPDKGFQPPPVSRANSGE